MGGKEVLMDVANFRAALGRAVAADFVLATLALG